MKKNVIISTLFGFLLVAASYALLSEYIEVQAIERELEKIARADRQTAFSGTFRISGQFDDHKRDMKAEVTHRPPDEFRFVPKMMRHDGKDWKPGRGFPHHMKDGRWPPDRRGPRRGPGRRGKGDHRRGPGPGRGRGGPPGMRPWGPPIIDPALTASNYDVTRVEDREIAGRQAIGWRISSRRKGPTFKVWADSETSLTLAYELSDPERKHQMSFTFESIEIESVSETASKPKRITLDELKGDPPFPIWIPEYIPKGFRLHEADKHSRHGKTMVKLQYTDGMAMLMVLQTPKGHGWWGRGRHHGPPPPESKDGKPVVHRSCRGGMEMMKVTLGETSLTFMGPVDAEELTAMITSMIEIRPKE
jgi:hypothetical protein